jgi:hypothetical protein
MDILKVCSRASRDAVAVIARSLEEVTVFSIKGLLNE